MSGSKRRCECCGQPLPNEFGFSLDNGYVLQDGIRIRLTKQEFTFLEAVVDAHPRPARHDYIIERVWPDCEEPDNVQNSIGVLANKVRNRTGIMVKGAYNGAYIIGDAPPRYTHASTRRPGPVTQEQKDRTQDLYDMGYSWDQIAAMVGRSHQTLRQHIVLS